MLPGSSKFLFSDKGSNTQATLVNEIMCNWNSVSQIFNVLNVWKLPWPYRVTLEEA